MRPLEQEEHLYNQEGKGNSTNQVLSLDLRMTTENLIVNFRTRRIDRIVRKLTRTST